VNLRSGVDLVSVERFSAALQRHGQRLLQRLFTETERQQSGGRTESLAVRFAAKEAVSKALGVGMRMLSPYGIGWREVEVLGDLRGRPAVILRGRAAEIAAGLGVREWAVSLSHTKEYAVAFVVAM